MKKAVTIGTKATEKSKKEFLRYLENAEQDLEKAKSIGDFYQDEKYIKRGGHTIWLGLLLVLEDKYKIRAKAAAKKTNPIVVVDDYFKMFQKEYGKEKTIYINHLYNVFHVNMGYNAFNDKPYISKKKKQLLEIIDIL